MASSPPYAFVTLVTSDHYLPGALVVAAALKDVHTSPPPSSDELEPSEFHTVCLVTPETVDVNTIRRLREAFDVVVGVEVIEQDKEEGLTLLGRLDLKAVLTKLHVFRLTSYRKIIFLDADVLTLRPISHLFRLSSNFAAVPDVGWPDIFNSGFMVLEPSEEKFNEVMGVVKDQGSWDGGDQGVLNEWIGPNWERLSFTYNTTPTAVYTYAPAYKRFGSQIVNVHFIGPNKPWTQIPYRGPGSTSGTTSAQMTSPAYDFPTLLDRWFDVYDRHYRPPMEDRLQGFPTVEEVPPGAPADPVVRRYQNVWDAGPGQNVSGDSAGQPFDLDELKRLAIEGMNQSELESESGEGVYRTLPLEGRIDLMRPPKPVVEVTSPQEEVHIVVPEDPQTPVRSFPYVTALPTPGPNELPPAPALRGHSLPPETPTYAGQGRQLFDTPTRHPGQSPSPLGRPPSPPLLLWNPAVEEPPRVAPAASSFPQETYYENAWDAKPKKKAEQNPADLFTPPPPPPIPEILLRQGHYKDVIGDVPPPPPRRQEHWVPPVPHHHAPHVEHHSSPVQHFRSEEQQHQPPQEYHPPAQHGSSASRMPQSYEQARTYSPPASQPQSQYSVGRPPPPASDSRRVGSEASQSSVQSYRPPAYHPPASQPYPGHQQQYPPPPPQPSYPKPDRSKVGPVFPWEEKPRPAPERVYPRTDSPPPGQPFIERRPPPPPMKIETRPRTARVFQDLSPSPQGFPRTTTYGNAWDAVPSIQRYAARLVRPPPPPTQPLPSPSGRRRKGSNATRGSDEYKRWEEMVEVNSHDADDEDEDDEEDTSPQSGGAESDQSIKLPSRLPPKKYKVKGVQTMERVVKHQSVQVSTRTRSRSASVGSQHEHGASSRTKKGHEEQARSIPSEQAPSHRPQPQIITELPLGVAPVPELSPATAESRRLSAIKGEPSTSPHSALGPTSPPESAPTPPVYPKHRPARRTFDPARGVDVFKKGSEEVLARFLRMDSWETDANPSSPGPGTPSIV